jgi:hypothetical protein
MFVYLCLLSFNSEAQVANAEDSHAAHVVRTLNTALISLLLSRMPRSRKGRLSASDDRAYHYPEYKRHSRLSLGEGAVSKWNTSHQSFLTWS